MPKGSLGLHKVNMLCDPQVMRGFRWLADARGTTYSELLRLALREYIVREIAKEQENIKTLSVVSEATND
jgi:hypothetical protein